MHQLARDALEKYGRWYEHYQKTGPRSAESDEGLEAMYTNIKMLQEAFALESSIRQVIFGRESSIIVYWNFSDEDLTKDNVVVELSPWGPLAAVYPYGATPPAVLHAVETALERLGLYTLSEDEIDELYELGVFTQFF